MQIILSPAKLMAFDKQNIVLKPTKPHFSDKTKQLITICKQLSVSDIADKMRVNNEIARRTYEYFQTFHHKSTPTRAAILAYNGIVYKGLNAHDFGSEDFEFAQNHLNIISGLYGFLRPLDEIKPYRLEMAQKIVPQGYNTLYDFWRTSLNDYIAEKMKKDDNIIINLASNEYAKIIDKKKIPKAAKIIDIQFLQQKDGDLKQIVVHSKKARGLMSRFIIKNKLTQSENLKAFDYENYYFYPPLSNDNLWTFVH